MAKVHRVKGLEFDHVILAGKLDDEAAGLTSQVGRMSK
jgi:superfamily I DNA/RNA helicase